MSLTVQVELGERAYPIRIGRGGLARLGEACRGAGLDGACLLVSDTRVAPLYAGTADRALRAAGYAVRTVVVPAGEASKCAGRLGQLYDAALDAGLDRRGFFVALGGGVVGDLAGFAAATYLRGVALAQVPTTLLAMVDSSVGGKTGINLPRGKNLVGAFHQPALVEADPATLLTLSAREYRAGLAEVLKYGLIRDPALLGDLEREREALLALEGAVLERTIAACCRIKADVVAGDEREAGLRAVLNFGHTLGHAVEQAAGYGAWLHGEAVAVGLLYALRLSERLAGLDPAVTARVRDWLAAVRLPVAPPDLPWERVRDAMAVDKKAVEGVPRFVLAEEPGRVRTGVEVPAALAEEVWHECRQ